MQVKKMVQVPLGDSVILWTVASQEVYVVHVIT